MCWLPRGCEEVCGKAASISLEDWNITKKKREGKRSQAKVKWKIAYVHVSRGLEHLLFWVTQREKRWRRIEKEKNPFGKVDADQWDWRQAGQSATEEGCVCVGWWVSVMCLCVCLRAWGVPDYFPWLIRPSIRLTCRTFQSSEEDGGGGEMEREISRKKRRGEKNKNQ